MKKLILITTTLLLFLTAGAQVLRQEMLQDLEKNQSKQSDIQYITATLTSATRLFAEKNDLTAVIMVLPSGASVQVIDVDSVYMHVVFEDTEGYIFGRHATLDETPAVSSQQVQQEEQLQEEIQREAQPQQQEVSRFTYLENKYGTNMAARLMAGKIWKGMTAEMVSDSWGTPLKINRSITGNFVKEEWIYRNTWLYIENNNLRDWGPIRR